MWGREMRAGLVFILVSLLAGGAFREWRRSHESRFRDFVASLEAEADPEEGLAGPAGPTPPGADSSGVRTDRATRRAAAKADGVLLPGRLDPDRADTAEWERLPGIGPALARRIVADREAHGPFGEPDALLRVPGIGPRTLQRIRPFLRTPVRADSEGAN